MMTSVRSLPAPPPPAGPDRSAPPAAGAAWPAVVFLFLFAFLLASFPARDADIWVNLTAGRRLLSGSAADLSPTWLFDAGVYALFTAGGGFAPVFAKAVAVGLAGVLMLVTARRAGGRGVVAVACVGLAVLALSQRAYLKPSAASIVFLAAAMVLAGRPLVRVRDVWPLALLFLVWANIDRGFMSGLLVVAAVWAGRAFDGTAAPRRLAAAFAAVAVATLFNPEWWAGFPLQAEFSTFRTPLSQAYARAFRDSPAVLAYYPLLVVGLISFVLNRRRSSWARSLPWTLAAGLSVWSDRAVPLFAVVGGPVLAINLSEVLAARPGRGGRRAGVLALPVAAVFLAAAWPGWLQAPPYEPRRWGFDLPPSPAAAAERLRAGSPAGRSAHLTPESLYTFAWHCPEDPAGYDPEMAAEFAAGRPVAERMRAGGFTRVVMYHPEREQLLGPVTAALKEPAQWSLAFVRGDVAVFDWRDPAGGGSRSDAPAGGIDLARVTANPSVPLPDLAPLVPGPDRPRRWWTAFTTPAATRSLDRDQAGLLVLMAQASRGWVPTANVEVWQRQQAAAIVGAMAGPPGPAVALDAAGRFVGLFSVAQEPFLAADDCLVGAVYAAVRAGRRAVAERPDDALAHLSLGEAYLLLLENTRERAWVAPFVKLGELRQAQASASLRRAIDLSPRGRPPIKAHMLMAYTSFRLNHLDIALDNYAAAARAATAAGRPDAALDREVEKLAADVGRRRERYDREGAGGRTMNKANLAMGLGLKGMALELLQGTDVALFGPAGAQLQLELMTRTGRSADVIAWGPDAQPALGRQDYHWMLAQARAAVGDYAGADGELAAIVGGPDVTTPRPDLRAQRIAEVVGLNLLAETPVSGLLPDAINRANARLAARADVTAIERQLRSLAEVSVLRGVLALEVGDADRAAGLFADAIQHAPDPSGGTDERIRTIAAQMADRLRRAGR